VYFGEELFIAKWLYNYALHLVTHLFDNTKIKRAAHKYNWAVQVERFLLVIHVNQFEGAGIPQKLVVR